MEHGRFRRDPPGYPGMRIGLFGGSFDPAHPGHRHVAETACKALELHKVWWLVTPQNPLKPKSSPLSQRLQSARTMARGRAQIVTNVETRLGVRFSADTIAALRKRYPGVQFVWVMGGDAMETFHRWRRWRAIMRALPIVIVAREPIAAHGLRGPALARFADRRARVGRGLAAMAPPAWIYLSARLDPHSSSQVRENLKASGGGDNVL